MQGERTAQGGHATIAAWESDIEEILVRWNADTPLHKAMSGALECVAVPEVDISALTRRVGGRRPRWDYVASRA